MKRFIKKQVPASLQGILWSTNVKNLDLNKDVDYIINQVLSYGALEQIRWLFNVYNKNIVKKVFLKRSQNVYTPPALNFVKRIILGLRKTKIDKNRYVKNLF